MKKNLYKGRIFEVEQEDWKGHRYDFVRHHGGVGILLVQDGKILLVRQYRPAVQAYMLEIPAGKLEKDEDPYACGMRELNEETGYECDRLELVNAFYSTPGFCDELLTVYRAVHPRPASQRLDMDPDEEIDLVWLDLRQAYEMACRQEIRDAKTLVALYWAILNER